MRVALGNQGILDKNYFTAKSVLFGNLVELLFTSFGISVQFNKMKNDQFQKQFAEAESANLRTLVHVVCHDSKPFRDCDRELHRCQI